MWSAWDGIWATCCILSLAPKGSTCMCLHPVVSLKFPIPHFNSFKFGVFLWATPLKHTPGSAHSLLWALCSEIAPGRF